LRMLQFRYPTKSDNESQPCWALRIKFTTKSRTP